MSALLNKYKLTLFFLFAFLIRLIHLDQSLWLDEATTAMTVKTYSLWQIVTQFSPHDFHPPFYYLFMDIWTLVFGYSEIALRMPSVIFSLGAGWFVYKAVTSYGLRVKNGGSFAHAQDDTVGFWSAAFFLLNPLIVYYSQEARMYAMVTFFVAGSFYFLVKMRNEKFEMRNVLLMTLFLILSFYTFYASIFYIAAVYGYLMYLRSWKLVIGSLGIWLIALIPLAPLLYTQYSGSKIALEQVTNWSMVLGNVSLKNLLLIPLKFTSGRISFEPKMLYYALSGVWMMVVGGIIALLVFFEMFENSKKTGSQVPTSQSYDGQGMPGMTVSLLYFLLFPLVLGTIFSFLSPLLQYFRFQYLIVFLSMLLGISVCHPELVSGSPPVRFRNKFGMTNILPVVVTLGFTVWSLIYLLNPQFQREDWKSLAASLNAINKPVYMILSSSDPLRYYAPDMVVHDLRMLLQTDASTSLGMTQREIVIIPYTAEIHGVEYRTALEGSGFQNSTSHMRRNVGYEVWNK